MKKEVVYSLLAAAAFPGMAMADAGVTPVVNTQNWTGGEYDATNSVYVSNSGEKISVDLGQKAKGRYTINIANIDATRTALKVTVAGVTKEIAQNETSVSVDFTLNAAGKVTVEVEPVTPQKFSVGGTTVTLKYDFTRAHDLLNAKLSEATTAIAEYNKVPFDNGKWQLDNATFRGILDNDMKNGAARAYEVYVEYELYNIAENATEVPASNPLLQQIDNAWNDAAENYGSALYENFSQSENFQNLQTAWENASPTVKSFLQAQYDKITNDIAKFQTDYKTQGRSYDFNANVDAINAEIDQLIRDIASKTTDVNNNQDAYDKVNTAAENAKGSYLIDLAKALPGDVYKNVLNAGNKALSAEIEKLDKNVKPANQASYEAYTAVADSTDRMNEIRTITANLNSIYTDYSATIKNALDVLEGQYNNVAGLVDSANAQYTKEIVDQYPTERDAVTAAIGAVRTAIDNAQTGTNADCQALKTLDITDLLNAVTTANNALIAKVAPEKARVDAQAAAQQTLTGLDATWQAAQDSVASLKYDAEAVKTYDWATGSGIQSSIDQLRNDVNRANTNKTPAGEGVYATIEGTKSTIEGTIAQYVTAFTDAANNYNTVNDSVNATEARLADTFAQINGKAAYNDKSYNRGEYDYKANYQAVLQTITDAKDDIADAKDKSKQPGKTDNTDAAKALSFDASTVDAFIDHVTLNFKADSAALQHHLDEVALGHQKDAVNNHYQDLMNNYNTVKGKVDDTTRPLGNDTEKIKGELEALKQAMDDNDLAQKVADAMNAEDGKTLGEINSLVDSLTNVMESILADVKAAEEAVAKNIAEHNAQVTALGNLNWDPQAIKDAAGRAYSATDGTNSNNEKNRIDSIITEIQKAYDAANDSIANSYGRQTSVADHDKIEALITVAKNLITAAKDSAANMKTNYDNFMKLVKLDGGELKIYSGSKIVNDVIVTAGNDAETADGEAGKTYYKEQLIGVIYQNEADTLLAHIKEQYKNQGFVGESNQSQKNYATTISNLIDKIEGVKGKRAVETNHDGYYNSDPTKGLKAHEKEVEDYIRDRGNELASKDQSSKLPGRQEQLNGYLNQLIAQSDSDLTGYNRGDYGQYGAKGVENNTYLADNHKKLDDIYKSVKTLVDNAVKDSTIKADIAYDNENMMDAITKAKDESQTKYREAINFIDAFKTLKSNALVNLDENDPAVKNAYDAINDQTTGVYTYAQTIVDKYAEAKAEYGATTPPDIFDRDSSYVNTFRSYTADIDSKLDTFIAAVKNALNTNVLPGLQADSTLIAQAKSSAKTDYNWTNGEATNWDSFFKPLSDKVTDAMVIIAKEAITGADYTELDGILKDLEDNFETELSNASDNAAKADVISHITDAESDVAEARAEIDDGTLDAFNTNDASKVEQARQLYTDGGLNANSNANYDEIKRLITEYNTSNAYQTFLQNNTAFATAISNLEARRTQLNNGLEAVKDYACVEALKTQSPNGYNDILDLINTLTSQANSANVAAPRDRSTLNRIANRAAERQEIYNNIENLFSQSGNLFDKEKEYLDARMVELTAEYNYYAASADSAGIVSHRTEIDAIQQAINDAAAVTPASNKKASDLQKLEERIKAEMDALAREGEINDMRTSLNESLAAVEDKAAWGDADQEVKDDPTLSAQMDALTDDIAEAKTEIENASLFDRDRINAEIDALEERADQLAQDIAAKDAQVKAVKAAIAKANDAVSAYFQALNDMVQAGKADIDATFTLSDSKSDKFSNKYDQITADITSAKSAVDAYGAAHNNDLRYFTRTETDGNVVVDESKIAKTKAEVANDLLQIKNLAAYRQLQSDLGTMEVGSKYYDAQQIFRNLQKTLFTDADYTNIVNTLYPAVTNAYTAAQNKISRDWNNGVSYAATADVEFNNSNYKASEDLIAVFDNAVKALKEFYDKNVTMPDFNRDGEVNNADVDIVKNAVLSGADKASVENPRIDFNGDGVIDIFDIQTVIKASRTNR